MEDGLLKQVRECVCEVQGNDRSGHGMRHVDSVVRLCRQFLQQIEADGEVTLLTALLHDADDYKLVGQQHEHLENARNILKSCQVEERTAEKVLKAIDTIGFSKRLQGVVPDSIEAMIVSDADMCDASGASGIIRAYQYSSKIGSPFFDPDVFPQPDLDAEGYRHRDSSTVNHLFEKILKLSSLMLTQPGKEEGLRRESTVIAFLENYFRENDYPEWREYLNDYLKNK